jgi:hypothetical protein
MKDEDCVRTGKSLMSEIQTITNDILNTIIRRDEFNLNLLDDNSPSSEVIYDWRRAKFGLMTSPAYHIRERWTVILTMI